ncbi:MAG: nitrate reductase cytochrome c-type subunit [Flavobacteriaceae bacterium]
MKRLGIISLFVILFAAFIGIWNYSYRSGLEEAYIPTKKESTDILIPSEQGVFQRSEYALDYANMPIDEAHQRSLETYYDNRAYHGAPPSIPHPVEDERNMGGNSCLKCHHNGGFVTKYDAYAPVTPHPDLVNCRQCHVPQVTETLFKPTVFEKVPAPKAGINNALAGSPPVIPHQIQMRENCLSCHAGPGAPKEIRVSHPERVNCRQCHVPNNKEVTDIGVFKRAN